MFQRQTTFSWEILWTEAFTVLRLSCCCLLLRFVIGFITAFPIVGFSSDVFCFYPERPEVELRSLRLGDFS